MYSSKIESQKQKIILRNITPSYRKHTKIHHVNGDIIATYDEAALGYIDSPENIKLLKQRRKLLRKKEFLSRKKFTTKMKRKIDKINNELKDIEEQIYTKDRHDTILQPDFPTHSKGWTRVPIRNL